MSATWLVECSALNALDASLAMEPITMQFNEIGSPVVGMAGPNPAGPRGAAPPRRRAFTLLEVMVAASVITVMLLALLSTHASASNIMTMSHDQIQANAAAKAQLETLMVANWDYCLAYYNRFLVFSGNGVPLPVPFIPGTKATGYPEQNGGYMFVTVREPTSTEAPLYKKGTWTGNAGTWIGGSPGTWASPISSDLNWPATLPQIPTTTSIAPPNGPSLLVCIVEINIPPRGSQPPVYVRLQAWRSFVK